MNTQSSRRVGLLVFGEGEYGSLVAMVDYDPWSRKPISCSLRAESASRSRVSDIVRLSEREYLHVLYLIREINSHGLPESMRR